MYRLAFVLIFAISFFSCKEEEFPANASTLLFSADTLLFDTVFSSLGSVNKRLKVYNPGDDDVIIPEIFLGGGANSPFNLIVSGEEGRSFQNKKLAAGDSLLMLVDVTIDPQDEDLPYIVSDSIVFQSGLNEWSVDLVAWGQDAYFLNDSILSCNTIWTSERPYVIYNSVLIDTLCQLTVEAGARIYSHPGSAIFVKGSIAVNGNANEPVVFGNDRFDPPYDRGAGQWEGIYFLEGSKDNSIEYTEIRNSKIGLRMGSPDDDDLPDLVLKQVRIENMSEYGILAFTSDLYAENLLITNCRSGGAAFVAGGNYTLKHCTIANYPIDFLFDGSALTLSDNVVLANNELLEDNLFFSLTNSVIWGLSDDELTISITGNNVVDIAFNSNFLKTQLDLGETNNTLNEDPLFTGPQDYNYLPLPESMLINGGQDDGVSIDLLGNTRSVPPDIGALEVQ